MVAQGSGPCSFGRFCGPHQARAVDDWLAPEGPLQKVHQCHWDLLKVLSLVLGCDAAVIVWCVLADC